MSVDISRLAFALCKRSERSFHPIKRTHALELIAAALGYRSYAAYKDALRSGKEAEDLKNVGHVVIDHDLIFKRSKELNSMSMVFQRLDMVLNVFTKCLPRARRHKDSDALFADLLAFAGTAALEKIKGDSALAGSDTKGSGELYLPSEMSLSEIPPVGQTLNLEIDGLVTLAMTLESPYAGRKIDVQLLIQLERLGKVMIAKDKIVVVSAHLAEDGAHV